METPAWADEGATGLTGLLFKWTADLFNHLFWIVLDAQLKTERNILWRWQCIQTMLCSAYSLQSFLWQYKKTVELLLFAVMSSYWTVSCLQVLVSGCFDLLHCKMKIEIVKHSPAQLSKFTIAASSLSCGFQICDRKCTARYFAFNGHIRMEHVHFWFC